MIKRFIFAIAIIALTLSGANALDFPALTGRVVDEAGILSPEQEARLTETLKKAEPHQVVAVSLKSLRGDEIEEYGVALGRHWGIGRKEIDDGVLVIIAPEQRQMRIEVGYGLEGTLTDAKASQIINRIMLPLAKKGKYDESLIKGSEAVLDVLNGGTVAPQVPVQEKEQESNFWRICCLFPAFFVVFKFIWPKFRRIYQHEKEISSSKLNFAIVGTFLILLCPFALLATFALVWVILFASGVGIASLYLSIVSDVPNALRLTLNALCGLAGFWSVRLYLPYLIKSCFSKLFKAKPEPEFTENEKKQIAKNKKEFKNLWLAGVIAYSIFIVFFSIYFDFYKALAAYIFFFIHSFIFMGDFFELKNDRYFTNKAFRARYHSHGSGSGRSSGGRGGFSGGGGSFGGGGASGRW